MKTVQRSIWERIPIWRDKYLNLWRIRQLARKIARQAKPDSAEKPVVVFNASTRLEYMSQNGAFSLLTAWGLRLAGIPVIHFVCQRGMSRCILGSTERNYLPEMPCKRCMGLSAAAFSGAQVQGFSYSQEADLVNALESLNLDQLAAFRYQEVAYGEIVLPSVRWCRRRHTLEDDEKTRSLFREFILSAFNIRKEFEALLDQSEPRAVVVFNGLMFPEAIVRQSALQRGIPVYSHEVGYQPFSMFITQGEATARQVYLTESDLELSDAQNEKLDKYLSERFQGKFTMAGIKFWQGFEGLDEQFNELSARFTQIVPIFTNVIFDTSQPHANVVYEDMFTWLDDLLTVIKAHPETLFVIRAHPDEMRNGKASHQTVKQWADSVQAADLPNVKFIESKEYISSYDLIQRAKFVIVYNSSIGLESVLLGKAVLCGGESWYSHYPIVYFPKTKKGFLQQARQLLEAEEVSPPENARKIGRGLLYYQNFRAVLSFERFLEPHTIRGQVRFKHFSPSLLKPENAPAIMAFNQGIKRGDMVITIPPEDEK